VARGSIFIFLPEKSWKKKKKAGGGGIYPKALARFLPMF